MRGLLLLGSALCAAVSTLAHANVCPALPDVLVQWNGEAKRAEITHVRPRSPAAKLGVRPESWLLAVNDADTAEIIERPAVSNCAEGTGGSVSGDVPTQRLLAALVAAQATPSTSPQKLHIEMADGRTRTLWVPRASAAAPRAFTSLRRENVLIIKVAALSLATLDQTQRALRRARAANALFLDVREAQDADKSVEWLRWLSETQLPVATIVSPWTAKPVVQFAAQLRQETAAPIVGALPPNAQLDRPPIASWRNEYGTEAVFATARDALSIIKR